MAGDAQFVIDIAAKMTGADTSSAQLRELTDTLTGYAGNLAVFDAAIDQTKAALGEASAASAATAEALAIGQARYRELEVAANKAAQAVDKARAAGRNTGDLEAKAQAARDALVGEADALEQLRAKAKTAAEAESTLTGTLRNLEAASKKKAVALHEDSASLEQMTYLTKGALGPMGGMLERGSALVKGLGSGGVAGAVLLVVAASVLAMGAIVGLVAKMAELAFTSATSAAKLDSITNSVTGSTAASSKLKASIATVAGQVPIATSKLNDMARKLYEAGLRGAELEKKLRADAIAAIGLGKNASAADLAVMFKDPAYQAEHFKELVSGLFEGVRVDGVLKLMQTLIGMFDQSTSSGKALKTLAETILNPLFDMAEKLVPIAKDLFRGMIVGAIEVAIVVIKAKNAIMGLIPDGLLAKLGGMTTAFTVGKYLLYGLVGALAIAGAVLGGIIVVASMAATAAFELFIGPIIFAAGKVYALVTAIGVLAGWLGNIGQALVSWAAAGVSAAADLISGLVSGISGGAGAVFDAIRNMATGAIGTLKNVLGIHSPSKVFAVAGNFSAQGFAEGIDQGSVDTQSALERMSAPPDPKQGGKVAGGSTSGGNTFYLEINAPSGDGKDIAAAVEAVLTRILEGDLTQVAGGSAV